MRKRKLTKQIASFSVALAMAMGCLSNVPLTTMAQTATDVMKSEEIAVSNNTNSTGEIDYSKLNSEIYDNIDKYPVGNMDPDETIFEDAIEVDNVNEYYQHIVGDVTMTLDDEMSIISTVYPSAVDNSTNENAMYLPDVLSQYGGSCTSYAYVYAVGSYIINQARGNSSKVTSNVLSPLFAYNTVRGGIDSGANPENSVCFLQEIGVSTAKYAPISTDYNNYYYTWYPTEEAWTSATDNRIENVINIKDISHYGTPITSADDSDLDLIKATLSSGKIIGFATYFLTFNYTVIPSSSPSHADEYAVDRCDYYCVNDNGSREYGGHAMVIVGYDDNIWIDVNRDGKQQQGEFGALKIMNSHGKWYENSGFVWVAYDALNKVSSVITDEDVTRVNSAIDAGTMTGDKIQNKYRYELFSYSNNIFTYTASKEESASSGCRLVATFNTDNRQDIIMHIIAEEKATGKSASYMVPMFKKYGKWSEEFSLDGSKAASDGTIVIDLDNVISDITSETMDDYTWSVKVSDENGGITPLIVKDLAIKVNGEITLSTDLTGNMLNGSTAIYKMEKDSIHNTTTIYYDNSWDESYIHYKVDNGEWTTAPGVKMESDSSKTGYQWKYVIDMGRGKSATVCFNNGNGTWDSKNGANYIVGVGTYGIKNSTVNEIKENLTLEITASQEVGAIHSGTVFTAQAGNGTEPYTYQFAMVPAGITPTSDSYTVTSSKNVYYHYTEVEGDYTLYVKATDATGKTGEARKTYTVEGTKWTISVTSDNHKVGTPVTINAVAKNVAYDKYSLYAFIIEKEGKVFFSENVGVYGNLTWTPTEEGVYTITAQYKTYRGDLYETQFTYEVYGDNETTIYYSNSSWSQAYIHYQVGNGTWTTAPGVKMSSNTSSNGYTWKYVIDLGSASNVTLCFNNGNGSWDSKNGANYKLGVGTYGIKNNTINELEDKLSVSVKADKAVGGTFTTTKFTATAVNGTAPYTYKLAIVKASETPTDSNYFSISDTGVYNYTPYTEGNYTVYAKVTDANGKTAVTSMSYTIEGPKFKTFTATATDKKVGTPVTLTAEFVNVQYDRYNSYSFEVEKDGVVTEYYADSTGTYVWTPTEAGTYTITAKFTTYLGTVYEKEMTYEVSNGNTVTIYYNTSWSNANIHYCIAGGSWTAVPGVAMTKTSEKSGYTHKIVIDLGDATSVTACFNNGNGTWDSKNGSNYTISAGTYGVSNGSVYKLN